jgi:hypothetical protein
MWLEWRDGRISFIRDYRHVGYVVDDAELVLASGKPSGGGAPVSSKTKRSTPIGANS